MRAMVLHRFAPAGAGMRLEEVPTPEPGPGEALVRVHASSVNPIDVRRSGGYGRNVFAARGNVRLPLILGRDVSGTVAALGPGAEGLAPGDPVWGTVNNLRNGAFAEYVALEARLLRPKPPQLGHEEAASLPYVALTAWTALVEDAGLREASARGKRVLVLGGAGGVGSFAVQFLKAWGAEVAATCGPANLAFVQGLGADPVIDYTREDFAARLREYDVVLNAVDFALEGRGLGVLKRFSEAQYVTIVHPVMPLTDRFGFRVGHRLAMARRGLRQQEQRVLHGRGYHWSMIRPEPGAFATVAALVEGGRIRPVVTRTYPLEELEAAFQELARGHVRGKLAVRVAA
jgi:NADPH:quinone reductase-like Zn-dependent oxidoreductase